MNWEHNGCIWWGLSSVGSVPGIFKSSVTHSTTSNWSSWKIMMHQVRLWVNWWIFHQVRVFRQSKDHSALDQAVGQMEDLPVSGQAVGQLKEGSVLGQLVGELRIIFLCQLRLWSSQRIVLSGFKVSLWWLAGSINSTNRETLTSYIRHLSRELGPNLCWLPWIIKNLISNLPF